MKLKKIGIFTASTPIGALFPKRLENAISFLEGKGYSIVRGNLISNNKHSYRSGTIAERIAEINYLLDSDIDILLSSIGGENSSSLLTGLPYEKINSKKITVCGFSDTTAILNAIVSKCPMARAIYSPSLVPNFGSQEEGRDISYENWLKILNEDKLELSSLDFYYSAEKNWKLLEEKYDIMSAYHPPKNKSEWKTINVNKELVISGILFGGNGSTLSNLLSSSFVPKFPSDGILFIEDAEKKASEVERIFSSFLIHGILKQAKAIILGKHDSYKSKDQKQPWEILKEILDFNNLQTPVIYDVDISHSRPMLSLELNKETIIDFNKKIIFQNLTKSPVTR